MNPVNYTKIVSHYEACLERYGDTHLGVDWPNKADVMTRYRVMLDVARGASGNISILDFGCGAAHLYEYIVARGLREIEYIGLDISQKFINLCKEKHPSLPFYCQDILSDGSGVPEVDYVIMNGVFTEKQSIGHEEMFEYLRAMLSKVYPLVRKGLAFNVMSKHVDWEREDLFHLSLDELALFVTRNLGRNFVIRNDYGLYEYTVYLYREPSKGY